MTLKTSNLVLIIDFGSQYTQLIARRVRENGVYAIIKSTNTKNKRYFYGLFSDA